MRFASEQRGVGGVCTLANLMRFASDKHGVRGVCTPANLMTFASEQHGLVEYACCQFHDVRFRAAWGSWSMHACQLNHARFRAAWDSRKRRTAAGSTEKLLPNLICVQGFDPRLPHPKTNRAQFRPHFINRTCLCSTFTKYSPATSFTLCEPVCSQQRASIKRGSVVVITAFLLFIIVIIYYCLLLLSLLLLFSFLLLLFLLVFMFYFFFIFYQLLLLLL